MHKKILIIFLSGLGNAVLFSPILRALKKSMPETKIDMLVRNKIVIDALRYDELVDNYLYLDNRVKTRYQLLTQIWRKKYDILITTIESQGWKLAFFAWLTRVPLTIGYQRGRWYDRLFKICLTDNETKQETERHCMILKVLNVAEAKLNISFKWPFKDYSYLDKHFDENVVNRICIHAGSSEGLAKKRWHLNNFIALGKELYARTGSQILFLGGENERYMIEQITMKAKYPKNILIGKLSLWETAYILKNADLLISNDTGLMHLAAALGTCIVAIFGPTDKVKNKPLGNRSLVISKNMLCSPCDVRMKCDRNMECLNEITVEEVFLHANDIVDRLIKAKANI